MKKVLICIITITVLIIVWDEFSAEQITKTWHQPKDVQYSFLNDLSKVKPPRLEVIVFGQQSPIRFWDLDNIFTLWVTYGGYTYGKEIDLVDGQGDYKSYISQCSVKWDKDAISFIEPSGVETKIPISMLKYRL